MSVIRKFCFEDYNKFSVTTSEIKWKWKMKLTYLKKVLVVTKLR